MAEGELVLMPLVSSAERSTYFLPAEPLIAVLLKSELHFYFDQ
jgi:hypothetical protein